MKAAFTFGILAALVAAVALLTGFDPTHSVGSGLVGAMAIQTAYSETQAIGARGLVANMTTYTADSLVCESAAIGFGVVVGQGTDPRGGVLGAAAATGFRGISVRDTTLMHNTPDQYEDGDVMAVMTRGDIWVAVGAAVTAGQDVSFVATTGVLSSAGASGSQFVIAGARWMTTQATIGGLAIVRLSGHLPVT